MARAHTDAHGGGPAGRDATVARGVAAWTSAAWRADAVAWLDQRLAAAGVARVGEVEQPHVRPWATVLRAPTTAGTVWFKAAGSGTAFEVALYGLLAEIVPERVLTPIATDVARAWVVLPDGGPSLGERLAGDALADALVAALVRYGELQREVAPHVDDLLALGVADMRPAVMVERLEAALEMTGRYDTSARARAVLPRVAAMRPVVASWCARLAASQVPASLDHNDLHPWNVLGAAGDARFYDWGDSVVAHPFAAMLVPLGFVARELRATPDDPRVQRARDTYLAGFGGVAPGEDLADTLEVACRVAKIARALTWHRALRAARAQDEAIDATWTSAPLETLASLLDAGYVGGA